MKQKVKIKGNLKVYLQWPIILAVVILVMNLCIYFLDIKSGVVMTVFGIIYLGVSITIYKRRSSRVMSDLIEFGADFAHIQKQLLDEMAIPYAMLDEDGKFIWMNAGFTKAIGKDVKAYKLITHYFPDITPKSFPKNENLKTIHTVYGDSYFRADIKQITLTDMIDDIIIPAKNQKGVHLYAMYLFDETQSLSYKKEIQDEKLVAGLIYLDNYEEALESVEEVRRSLLAALLERKINRYISSYDGILKKIEKDKYFIAIKQKYLEEIKKDKFSLLEDVKTVNIGNDMAVTISIGLGVNGESYNKCYEYARTAMDMALGRGGDQVVIKDDDQISYYGGKSQTQEKNTRVKARVKAHALRELISANDHVVIMGHKIADVDSLGAAIGIYRAAKASGKTAHIVIDVVTNSIKQLLDRFASNPEYEDDLFINGERAQEIVDNNTVLVVVDVNRPSYTECPQLLKKTKNIVVLDHHRQTKEKIENAILSYVEPYASSACEMVAEILQYYSDDVKIKWLDADALYSGIVIDTNNFLNKTGVRTFEAAAFLRRNGADVIRVRKLFRDTIQDYKTKSEAIGNATVFDECYAISVCPSDKCESPTIVASQAANELLDIQGIKASFVLTDYNGKIYVSARSIDEINVQVIMEKLGGGGHMTIAGAQLTGKTVDEAINMLKDILREMIEKEEL